MKMNNTELVNKIENDLVCSRKKNMIDSIPKNLRPQLMKIEKIIFHMWKLDPVYQFQVEYDAFQCCINSSLTLDKLEELIKKFGQKYSDKITYKVFFEKLAKEANKGAKLKPRFSIKKFFNK